MFHGEYVMTGSGPAITRQGILASASLEARQIEGRFGSVTVNPDQALFFPSGMLGMPDKTSYCLTTFPSAKMARFRLLQSLDEPALSFITLPVDVQNPILDRADIAQAAADLEMPIEEVAVLFVVTVHRAVSGAAQFTINARAPILVHAGRRLAVQYVFSNTRYQIRQPLAV